MEKKHTDIDDTVVPRHGHKVGKKAARMGKERVLAGVVRKALLEMERSRAQ
jgi:hypothetical protein